MSINEIRPVYILTTGGTIEKTYDEYDGSLINRESNTFKLVSKLRLPYKDVSVETVMQKDSMLMNDSDRLDILKATQEKLKEKAPIIIIHGTDTMDQTAQYLYENLKSLEVPIILTGAMRPLEMNGTDAIQNVIEAIALTDVLGPGVYISFHSRVFRAPNVKKNKKSKTFEAI